MLRLHHIGCVVNSIHAGIQTYAALGFRRRTRDFEVSSQSVSVCFLELAPSTYLELIQPAAPKSLLNRFMSAGFYHVGFLVNDLDQAAHRLRDSRFAPLPPFASEAFDGNRCQFFVTPERHLIECAEMTPDAFASFFAESVA